VLRGLDSEQSISELVGRVFLSHQPSVPANLHVTRGLELPEVVEALERYTTGLLTELPNKNCDTMAQAVPGTSEQRWQEFLTNMPWVEEALNRQRVQKMVGEATLGEGVLVLDDIGFAKQCKTSVGVARQDSGTWGQMGNCQFGVSIQCKAMAPVQRADALLQALPRGSWRTIRWRQGTKGWLRKQFMAVQCWRITSDGQRHVGWLLGERATWGQPEERKYYWSNLPAPATLAELAGYAHRRCAVEPFHEEAKGELGWDQDQGRLWPGFHRHAVTVMLAYSFLVGLELRQRHAHRRRGRPPDPFSLSTGSVADPTASDPS
jgi:SRSO17 transposase